MPTHPGAVYCPNCIYYRDNEKHNQVLGSVDMWGNLVIKRPHNLNTKVSGIGVLTLYCGSCNYMVEIQVSSSLKHQNYETV